MRTYDQRKDWKRTSRWGSPAVSPAVSPALPTPALNQVRQQHIHTAFKYSPGQSVQMPEHPFSEEISPNSQHKPNINWHNLSPFALVLPLLLGKKTSPHLTTTTFHAHGKSMTWTLNKVKCFGKKDYTICMRATSSRAWEKEIKQDFYSQGRGTGSQEMLKLENNITAAKAPSEAIWVSCPPHYPDSAQP